MRPSINRSIVLALSVIATACNPDLSSSPLSPTSASFSQAGKSVPFRGSIAMADQGVIAPPLILVDGTGEGNATHLGHFTATYHADADMATPTATGTFHFTAANGDQLVATFVGSAVIVGPGIVDFTEVFTIVSGTGRFVAATGTFTMRRVAHVDFATLASTSTASIDGTITLK